MQEQNFDNHRRLSLWYHGILFVFTVAALVYGVIVFVRALGGNGDLSVAIALLLMSLALAVSYYVIRYFAVTVQDRVIRAEENMRHYVLSGKMMSPSLTIGQVVALRFASDEEVVALAEQAQTENLSNLQIKEKIKNWRADHQRV